MIQNPAKRSEANLSASDMLVPIDARTKRRLRVIHVQHKYAIQPHAAIHRDKRRLEPLFRSDVVSGLERVRRVETNSHWQVRSLVQDRFDLLKPSAHGGTHSGSVFDKNAQFAKFHALRRLPHAIRNIGNGLCPVSSKSGTRMRNQKISAQRNRADQFIVKCLDRPRSHHAVRRRQVDQIIVVDDQRSEAKLRTASPKPSCVRSGNARAPTWPHSRACGKNLQRVRPQLRSGIERPRNISSNRGVDPNAKTAVLPGRRPGNRLGFRAIFVAFVVGGFRADQWVSHSLSTAFKRVVSTPFYRMVAQAAITSRELRIRIGFGLIFRPCVRELR